MRLSIKLPAYFLKSYFVSILFASLITLLTTFCFASPIRYAPLNPNGILNINTALGIATIIQLPEPIQSIIIGDQSGFKVEAIDKAITIKPLRWGAKTNLYLTTQKQRYNLRLHTERQETADFIVYVQSPKEDLSVNWKAYRKKVLTENFTFELLKVGQSQGGFILIIGEIKAKEYARIKPDQFWIYQNKKSKTMDGLYLSNTTMTSKNPIEFGISMALVDLEKKTPITLDLKLDSPLSIEIPSEVLWK